MASGDLNARLDATLTATVHGELSHAARDLPDLTALPAHVRVPGGKLRYQGTSRGPRATRVPGKRGAANRPDDVGLLAFL